MRCSKKAIAVIALLALVLASVSAWPSFTQSTDSEVVAEVKELPVVEAAEVKTDVQTSDKSSTQESTLQSAVSKMRETLSSNLSNSKKVSELEQALTDAELGVDTMSKAYTKLEKEYNKMHLALMPELGFTIGKNVACAFDFGISAIGSYKNWRAVVGIEKEIDFKNLKAFVTSFNGMRVYIGGGYQIF